MINELELEQIKEKINMALLCSGVFDLSLLKMPAYLLSDSELSQAIDMANLFNAAGLNV